MLSLICFRADLGAFPAKNLKTPNARPSQGFAFLGVRGGQDTNMNSITAQHIDNFGFMRPGTPGVPFPFGPKIRAELSARPKKTIQGHVGKATLKKLTTKIIE